MTTTTKSPEETRAMSRLRALAQGIRVFCLERDQTYCVPSGDGSAYQVQVSGETRHARVPEPDPAGQRSVPGPDYPPGAEPGRQAGGSVLTGSKRAPRIQPHIQSDRDAHVQG